MADSQAPDAAAGGNPQTAAGRYAQLEVSRNPFLQRARLAATLTIPGLMPPEGHTGANNLPQPWQSIGAEGVNNLSAKLLMALFPPGTGFFRLTMDDFAVEKLKQNAVAAGADDGGEDAKGVFEDALAKVERAATNRMEKAGNRRVRHEVFKHLIVCGNCLVETKKDGKEKMYPLDRYVVKRDLDGEVLEVVVKECLSRQELPARILALVQAKNPASTEADKEKNVDLYTWVRRTQSGAWEVHQEVEGSIIPETQGTYPAGKSAWIPLRWSDVAGEDYGRGRVEEYLGDHIRAEAYAKSIAQFTIQAAKVLWGVNPSGVTDKDDVANAPTGAVVSADFEKDVHALMLDKGQDFSVAAGEFDKVEKRLERAYLLANSVQRDAERVTAEEIRAMIGELEQALGGVYAILADEYQLPLASRVLHQMTETGKIPRLPSDIVSPQIVTGLDGLSRTSDAQRLQQLLNGMAETFGPQGMAAAINIGGYVKRMGAALGIDTDGIVRTEQEQQQAAQASQQSEMVGKLGPAAIKVAGDAAKSQLQNQQQTPTS